MNTLLNEDNEGYSWEGDYEQTWKAIQEDESGTLRATDDQEYRSRKRQMLEKQSHIRLSMMRHMFIILDASSCMVEKDLKPSRFNCVINFLEKFAFSYFDQNPISQLGLIITNDKLAIKHCELVGNPKKFVDSLQKLKKIEVKGEPSIQNAIELAIKTLKHIRSHSSREVLLIMGSLTSCDPGDIFETINECKKLKLRTSIIGLAAEVYICRTICQETEGFYAVILDELHLHDLLQKVAFPLPNSDPGAQTLIRMGFPQHKICNSNEASICMCHMESAECKFSTGGYFCPVCNNKYCELPVECKICGLTLVIAPHLARSYHHLFPLAPFKETSNNDLDHNSRPVGKIYHNCHGCQIPLANESTVFKCETCHKPFCIECDIFIHETLHSCPGCNKNQ